MRTFDIEDIIENPNEKDSLYSYPIAFAKMHPDGETTTYEFEGDDLISLKAEEEEYLDAFNIKLAPVDENNLSFARNFSGAAWVKNLCFDNKGEKTWQFLPVNDEESLDSKNFIDQLTKRHGTRFNWGVKYYRGKSIILWDTLRDFKS